MSKIKTAYCSWCLKKSKHDLHETHWYTKNEYVCRNCGSFVVKCTVCPNMAKGRYSKKQISLLKKQAAPKGRSWVTSLGDNWKNEYCAQHDGTVPDFETQRTKAKTLDRYPELLRPSYRNYKKVGTIAAGTLTTAGIVGLSLTTGGGAAAAASAAGKMGLLGTASTGTAIASLHGAALTSASLAAIGGSVATGTGIISAAGIALGGAHGAVVSKQYVGEDKYFDIRNLRRGGSHKTVFVNGFLKQRDADFLDWKAGHLPCFPNECLYGVTWASKDLLALGCAFAKGTTSGVAKKMFSRMGKKGKKIAPFSPITAVLGLVGNPWHSSMFRAAKTGAVLADAISRSKETNFTLVGHSLGCRVIYYALQALSTKDIKKVNDVIFLGGAVGKNDPVGWRQATKAIKGTIYNCYSRHDQVLSIAYRLANAGLSHPIGIAPIGIRSTKIKNIDCSRLIFGGKAHMEWKDKYECILYKIYP